MISVNVMEKARCVFRVDLEYILVFDHLGVRLGIKIERVEKN